MLLASLALTLAVLFSVILPLVIIGDPADRQKTTPGRHT